MPAEIIPNLPMPSYLRDEIPGHQGPFLSRSLAHTILTESPLHAWHRHPLLGNNPEEMAEAQRRATEWGTLLHGLVLGQPVDVQPIMVHFDKAKLGPVAYAVDYRKTEAQEQRDEIRAAGGIPILAHELEMAHSQAVIQAARIEVNEVPLRDCLKEVTILWHEGEPFTAKDGRAYLKGVPCKVRLDMLRLDGSARVWDLKFPQGGHPKSFQRGIPYAGYDIQAYVAERAVSLAYPELAGRVSFDGFLWCEPGAPWDVALVPLSASQLDLGRMKWERAVRTWRECLITDRFPGYGRLETIEASSFATEAELVAAFPDGRPDPGWMGDSNA